jgi:hypothetical protein
MVSGFSVHVNVCIEARDRMRLESKYIPLTEAETAFRASKSELAIPADLPSERASRESAHPGLFHLTKSGTKSLTPSGLTHCPDPVFPDLPVFRVGYFPSFFCTLLCSLCRLSFRRSAKGPAGTGSSVFTRRDVRAGRVDTEGESHYGRTLRPLSASSIRRINQTLDEELKKFATRKLEEEYPYLILDARYEKVREDGVIRSQAVMIAIGINWDGRRSILAVELAIAGRAGPVGGIFWWV